MKMVAIMYVYLLLFDCAALAAQKVHSVAMGRSSVAKFESEDESKLTDVKIRPLIVDGKSKEFTTGNLHDVTEKTFVVQRVFRLNDSLPQEAGAQRWRWQLGGWVLVDRRSGKIQKLELVNFDSYTSQVSWFRDYAAYCGVSDDGMKAFAMVMQLGRRKPLLKKQIGEATECPAPEWGRGPVRVGFAPKGGEKFNYEVRNRSVDMVEEESEE